MLTVKVSSLWPTLGATVAHLCSSTTFSAQASKLCDVPTRSWLPFDSYQLDVVAAALRHLPNTSSGIQPL
jgi:hypothetical protein